MTWDSLIRQAGAKESQGKSPWKDTERLVAPERGKRTTEESRGVISLKQRPGEIRKGDQNKGPMYTLNLKLNPHGPLSSGPWDSWPMNCYWHLHVAAQLCLVVHLSSYTCLLEDGLSYLTAQMLTTRIYNFIGSRKNLNPRLQSTTKHKSLKKHSRLHHFQGFSTYFLHPQN